VGDRIPEKAIEAVARLRQERDHPSQPPSDLSLYKLDAQRDLQAALPAIHRDLRERLLDDEAIKAAGIAYSKFEFCWPDHEKPDLPPPSEGTTWEGLGEGREDGARVALEAALNVVGEE
jgi:hypothetical protein